MQKGLALGYLMLTWIRQRASPCLKFPFPDHMSMLWCSGGVGSLMVISLLQIPDPVSIIDQAKTPWIMGNYYFTMTFISQNLKLWHKWLFPSQNTGFPSHPCWFLVPLCWSSHSSCRTGRRPSPLRVAKNLETVVMDSVHTASSNMWAGNKV